MKAIVYTRYGPVDALQLQEKEKPRPKHNEVLVKVHAASVNALDWRQFTMPFVARLLRGGLLAPKDTSFGVDLAGRVEAVGDSVTQFEPGNEVFGLCRGAFAEYVSAPEEKLVLKPKDLSFEAAAAAPLAGLTALQSVRDQGQVRSGQRVAISGAGGGVGTFAVQLAKHYGAAVTAECSARNQHMARSIGADHVVDYAREDFTRSGQTYDVIVAANGFHSILEYRRALGPTGVLVVAGGAIPLMLQTVAFGWMLTRQGGRRFRGVMTNPNHADLRVLAGLLQARIVVPVIDRIYPLDRVPDAVHYLLQGHASGKVVIQVVKPE
jgi:NADPH:quinone reductase-like Zn-dependent oxidoreductase